MIGAYFLDSASIQQISASGVQYAHVNTEVIANDMLNYNPEKVDFMGAYLPSMKQGHFIWDVIMDNMPEYKRYGANAHFLRWGFHPQINEIEHRKEKDLDFYFFGMMSERRKLLVNMLLALGFTGAYDNSCPYFLRNDRISRARIQLNLIQDEKYTHVNSFRICYLANNACCIVSENENDPANYLKYTDVTSPAMLIETMQSLRTNNQWKKRGEQAQTDFKKFQMNELMERLIDKSFSN